MMMLGGTRRRVPSGPIDQEHGVGGQARRSRRSPLDAHRLDVASGQDKGRALAILRADGAEDFGLGGALIARSVWARAALCPPAGNLVLLTDTSLILKPDFYLIAVDRLLARDCVQTGGEVFLKFSIAPAACA